MTRPTWWTVVWLLRACAWHGAGPARSQRSVAAASVGSVQEEGKRKSFNETGLHKAIALAVLTPVAASVVTVGGATPGHHPARAILLYEQALAGCMRVLGTDHPRPRPCAPTLSRHASTLISAHPASGLPRGGRHAGGPEARNG